MELTQEEIVELDSYFTKLSKTRNTDVSKLIALYNFYIQELEKYPSIKGRSRRYLKQRVESQIDSYFSNKKTAGERYVYIPYGQLGRTRDWAYKLFSHVEEEVDRGNIMGLIEDGRIMSMEVDGKSVPISSYSKYEFELVYVDVDNVVSYTEPAEGLVEFKKLVVTEGVKWKKGDEVVPCDFRLVRFNRVNFDYSRPLKHEWTLNLRGIAFPESNTDDVREFDVSLTGNQADITSPKYFFKNVEMFKAYQGSFQPNAKVPHTEWRYNFKSSVVETRAYDLASKNGMPADIEDLILHLKRQFTEEIKDKVVGSGEYTYPDQLVDFMKGFSELKQYHVGDGDFSGQVLKSQSGEIMKSEGRWDRTHWNKYGIMLVRMTAIKPAKKEGNSPQYLLTDSLSENPETYIWKPANTFKTPRPPCTCLAMFQTKRSPKKWDPVQRKKVEVPGGDLQLSICSIAEASFTEKEDEIKIEAPDMDDL